MRGTLWPSSQPTAGPATAPSTAAVMTGMTIVDVWPSSQMTPTMISTKPTSSHEENPMFLSQVGAVNCPLRSLMLVSPVRLRLGCSDQVTRQLGEWPGVRRAGDGSMVEGGARASVTLLV